MVKTICGVQNPHPSVTKLDKDHALFINNVVSWFDYNVQEALACRSKFRLGDKSMLAQRYIHEGYVKDIRHYLRTGDWISEFFGKHQEHKVRRVER